MPLYWAIMTLADEYRPRSCGQWWGIGIDCKSISCCRFSKHSASSFGTILGTDGLSIAHARVSMYSSGVIPIAAHRRSLVSKFTAAR